MEAPTKRHSYGACGLRAKANSPRSALRRQPERSTHRLTGLTTTQTRNLSSCRRGLVYRFVPAASVPLTK
jgi:hypothetical protein